MVLPEAHIGIYDGWALRRLCDTRNLSSTGDDGLIVRESLKNSKDTPPKDIIISI